MDMRPALALAALLALIAAAPAAAVVTLPARTIPFATRLPQHTYTGTLVQTRHTVLTLKLRGGQQLLVDATAPTRAGLVPKLAIGESLTASGSLISGVLIASSVGPASSAVRTWPADR
jgi:hypothetical protein